MGVQPLRAVTTGCMVLAVSAAVLPSTTSTAAASTTAASTTAASTTAASTTTINEAARADRQRRATVRVNTRRRGPGVSPLVLGSNHRFPYAGYGMWSRKADAPVRAALIGARRAGIKLLRYPGGSRANMFDWHQAIGPYSSRGCQVLGRYGLGGAVRAIYGIDEHMRFAAALGARTLFTVPIANETAGDAADLVEYMNTPVGRNPNGGVAWARVRAKFGHSRPYGVERWTIGNEPYLRNQRFWMSDNYATALRQYTEGGRRRYRNEQVAKGCKLRGYSERRLRHDRREILHAPVSKNAPVIVTVNGRKWRRVDDFAGVGRNKRVYAVNRNTGRLTFGNDRNGSRLPRGAKVRVSYTSVHPGFVDMAKAMHRVDRRISVCSEWARPNFVAYLKKRPLDCLAAHPYKIVTGRFASRIGAHNELIASERKASHLLPRLRAALRRHGHGSTSIGVSEYGAISVPKQPHAPHWDLGLSAALFKASQVVRMIGRGVPWAAGGALTSHSLRSTLGNPPRFTSSAWAVVARQLSPALRVGGRVVGSSVAHAPRRQVGQRSYSALSTVAVKQGHELWVVVLNRDPHRTVRAKLRLPKLRTNRVSVRTVSAPKVWSYNTDRHPHSVRANTRAVRLEGKRPGLRFSAHSVTVLRLRLR